MNILEAKQSISRMFPNDYSSLSLTIDIYPHKPHVLTWGIFDPRNSRTIAGDTLEEVMDKLTRVYNSQNVEAQLDTDSEQLKG